jgi:hypothetical protein
MIKWFLNKFVPNEHHLKIQGSGLMVAFLINFGNSGMDLFLLTDKLIIKQGNLTAFLELRNQPVFS